MTKAKYNPNRRPRKGPTAFIDITGQRFHRLTTIRRVEHSKHGVWLWEFRCDCGNVLISVAQSVRIGRTKSCGCLSRENTSRNMAKHRLSGTKEYNVWVSMRQRCSNPNHPHFKHYGGRGITVCDRWHSFATFFRDMGNAPTGYTLERKDNQQGYSPDNCCWATRSAQANNRRGLHLLTYNNQTLNVAQWAALLGLNKSTLHKRLKLGWPISLVLSSPVIPGMPLRTR